MERRDSRRERKIVIGLVLASALVVVFAVIMTFYFSPENNAMRELKRIAEEYYETFLYRSSLITLDNEPSKLAEFSEGGFRPVKLRQLLLYDGGKNKGVQWVFEGDAYKCDLDRSEVVYRPVAPYGAKDYTVEYRAECKKGEL